jgi:hypothetical protein
MRAIRLSARRRSSGRLVASLFFPWRASSAGVGLVRGAEQVLHLLRQLRLLLLHPLVAHRLVLGGVGLHLGPVQRVAELHQPRLLTDPEHLDEQLREHRVMDAPELADAGVVRMLVAGDDPERYVLVRLALDLPRRTALPTQYPYNSSATIICWVMGREPSLLALVVGVDAR